MKNNNILFEQARRVTHDKLVLDEYTIRFVFKPAPRFIPEKLWFKIIARLFVRQVIRKDTAYGKKETN